jgi:hypothetical protein
MKKDKLMKPLILLFALAVVLTSCCKKKDFTKTIKNYEAAYAALKMNKALFVEHAVTDNANGDILFVLSKSIVQDLHAKGQIKDGELLLNLWDQDLVMNESNAVSYFKNDNVYFLVSRCGDGVEYLVNDGGEEIELDVDSSNRKERVKENWMYLRMK